MSDSTRERIGADRRTADGLGALAPGASSPRWWMASILFHLVILAYLLFFSPVRVIDPQAKPATRQVSAAHARQVVEQIREKQAESVEQNLRTLEAIREQMAALESRKCAEFMTFAADQGKDVPTQAATDQQTIAHAQAEVLAALDHASTSSRLFVRTRANAYFDDLAEAQRLAREQQTRVLQLHERAQGVLSLGGDRYAPALQALEEACAAQERAAMALVEAEGSRDAARHSRKRTAHENQIEHYTYHLKRAAETIVNAETNLAVAKKRLATAEAVLLRRKAAAQETAAKAAAENTDSAKLAAEMAEKALVRAEKDLASAQKRVDGAPKEVEDANKRLPELEAKVAELLAMTPPEPVAPTPEDQILLERQTAARQLQGKAQTAQAKAAQIIAALQSLPKETATGTAALTALDKAAPVEVAPPATDVQRLNLAQLYQTAVRTEAALAQSYRRLRAVDLAMIRRLPLAKAIQLTEVAKVMRPDLASPLQSAIASGEDAVVAREAVQTAKAEVAAMVRLAGSLLSQAQGLDRSAGSTISFEDYNQQFEQWQKMEQLAAEEEGQWARDLTAMMGGAGGEGGEGWDGEGEGEGGGGGGTGRGGFGRGGAGTGVGDGGTGGGGLPDLGLSGIAGPFGDGPGAGGPGGFGRPGIPGASGADGAPEDVSQRLFPFPGRRIAARGPSVQWLYVDSWYILGPFDNTGRRNIEKKFPPETVIDLNATYPGKHGVPIRWEFQQSGTPNVMPHLDAYTTARRDPALSPADNYRRSLEYIIYYAYTELWFEEACDLWVAIGSDDFSKVRIEDQLVWSSGKRLKAWRLN